MTAEYPEQLTTLQANQGSAVDLERLQNAVLRRSLEELRSLQADSNIQLRKLMSLMERRTQVLSPAKAYSHETYTNRGQRICIGNIIRSDDTQCLAVVSSISDINSDPFLDAPSTSSTMPSRVRYDPPPIISQATRELEDTGIYETDDQALRAYVCPSPKSVRTSRPRTNIDLVLPPATAFSKPGLYHSFSAIEFT